MPDATLTFWTSFLVLLAATWIDVRERRVPNRLVAAYLAAGFAARSFAGADALWTGLAGLAVAAIAAGSLHLLTGLGMGDVKLLSAFGWWVGPSQLRFALPAVALAGGLLALGFLAVGIFRKHVLARGDSGGHDPRRQTLPYAPAIATGAMFSFFAH
jgi:prepilin peptidase CpaA